MKNEISLRINFICFILGLVLATQLGPAETKFEIMYKYGVFAVSLLYWSAVVLMEIFNLVGKVFLHIKKIKIPLTILLTMTISLIYSIAAAQGSEVFLALWLIPVFVQFALLQTN